MSDTRPLQVSSLPALPLKILIIFALLAAASLASAQERLRPLDPIGARLYRFVADSQAAETTGRHSLGGWSIYSKINNSIVTHEPNSLLTARVMILLHEVSRSFELPGYAVIEGRANANLAPFLYDDGYTGEPAGTIAFWPIRDYRSGRRGVDPSVSALIPVANVPNDLDSSSQVALWFLNSRQQAGFVRAFTTTVADFRDIGRIDENPNDLRWKRPNSGAFMTWAEPDWLESSTSRIPEGANNVDCVVDLNILTTLGQYRRSHALGSATERGVNATCRLIVDAIRSGAVPTCATYSRRSSQFWWAFAQASAAGVSCLDSAALSVRWRLLNRATEIAHAHEASSNGTEVAEILGALKRLYPAARRPARITEITERLEAILQGMVDEKGRLVTEDAISLSRGFGQQVEWYAPAYSSALALLAMTLP